MSAIARKLRCTICNQESEDDLLPGETHRDDEADLHSDGPLRALRVLETLAVMEQPAGLPSIAGTAGLPKSKAYRALRSLQDQGFVDHVGRSGYRIGSRSLALAAMIGARPAVQQCAQPFLTGLATIASATAGLHLRSGAHRVLVLGAQAPHQPLGAAIEVGERAPLTSGCSGQVILAHLPAEEADALIKSRPARASAPDLAFLAQIRDRGYAVSFSDNYPGLNGVAAPLLDPADGYPLGSVTIAGPQARLPESVLRRLSVPLVTACAKLAPKLARLLGPNSSQPRPPLDVTIQELLEV